MAPQIIKDATLPPGWEALYDDAQRVTYYWNRATNVTTYDRPAGAPASTGVAVRHILFCSEALKQSLTLKGIFFGFASTQQSRICWIYKLLQPAWRG